MKNQNTKNIWTIKEYTLEVIEAIKSNKITQVVRENIAENLADLARAVASETLNRNGYLLILSMLENNINYLDSKLEKKNKEQCNWVEDVISKEKLIKHLNERTNACFLKLKTLKNQEDINYFNGILNNLTELEETIKNNEFDD